MDKKIITAETAKLLERESKWNEAALEWGRLAAREHEAGDPESRSRFYNENASACMELHRAIKAGDELREKCSLSLEAINNLPEEEKRHLSWMIKGYSIGMLTKEARLEMEDFFNKYPAVPKQSIIDWAEKYYASWEV